MKKLIALALVSSLALAACGSDSSTTEETVVDTTMAEEMMMDDIVAVASATEGFATLVAAVAAADRERAPDPARRGADFTAQGHGRIGRPHR